MNKLSGASRSGSIYLITLITVAAIVSMVLIGISLRSASNSESTLIEYTAEGSMGVLDTTEVAVETITSDPIWRVTAQSGAVFGPMSVNAVNTTMTSTVEDAATGLGPTYDTTTYRVKMDSLHEIAKNDAQIDVLATQYDYLTYLRTLPLKHYWAMTEHSNPTTAKDTKGTYDGTYQVPAAAGASYNDEGGPVPVFSDTNDSVSVPWNKDFDQDAGAFSMWVRLTGTQKWTQNYAFFGMLYKANGVPAINMAMAFNAVYVYLNDKGNNVSSSKLNTAMDTITVNQWHHLAVTWGPAGLTIYIDGVEKAKKSSNTDKLRSASAGSGGHQPLYIGGGYNMLYDPVPSDGFVGSVAHVAMFNKQLKASEVAALAAVKPDLRTYSLVADSWQRLYDQ